jgi:hypothetical protein
MTEWRIIVFDTRPIRLKNNIARRAWLRQVSTSTQAKSPVAPEFLAKVEASRARKVVGTRKS